MTTPNLSLPELAASQSQPHLTVNASLRRLDAVAQISAINQSTNTPPGSPSEGDTYIVGASPTGAWSGHAKEVAVMIGGAWAFLSPLDGWLAFDRSDGLYYYFDAAGPTWTLLQTGGVGGSPTDSPAGSDLVAGAALMLMQTDFLAGDLYLSQTAGQGDGHIFFSNGGSFSFQNHTADRPGVITISSGVSNGAGVCAFGFTDDLSSPQRKLTLPTSDDLVLDYLMNVSSVSVTDGYWHVGLVDDLDTYANTIRVYLDSGVVKLVTAKSGSGTASSNFSTEPTAGSWHHIQVRCNSSSIRAYMDGTLQAEVTNEIPTVSMFPVFQAGNNGGTPNVSIDIDFFRMSRSFATPRSLTL